MSDKTLPRPPQATFLGGTILVVSVLLLLFTFDRMASLGSIEAQEEAQAFADTQGGWIGLSADGWQSVLRVLCFVAGGLSVVTGYLGWRVLQRDRGARLGLSVLAPFTLVSGLGVVAFLPAAMAVAVVMLWRTPVREWFDGRVAPPRPPREPQAPAAPDGAVPAPTQGTAIPSYAPPPGSAQPGVPVYAPPPNPGQPNPGQPNPYAPPPNPYQPPTRTGTGRPGTVSSAAIVTIVTSGVVIAFVGIVLLYVLGDRAGFEESVADEIAGQQAYQDLDIGASELAGAAIAASVVFLVWAVLAIVLAVLTLRGSGSARIALVVSSVAAALVGLITGLAVVPLVVTAAGIAVTVLLLRRDSAAWFAARKGS